MEDRTKAEFTQFEELISPYVMGHESFKKVLYFVSIVFRWFSAPLECFLRRRFGERYMTPLRISLGWAIVAGFAWIPTFSGKPSTLFWGIYVAYVMAGAWHQWVIFRRNRNHEIWYSHFNGEPWGIFKKITAERRELFDYFIEPVGCILVSLLLLYVDSVSGAWLLLASLALLTDRQLDRMRRRNKWLDQIDARIEAEYEKTMLDTVDWSESKQLVDNRYYVGAPKDILMKIVNEKERKPVEETVKHAMG